MVDALRVKLLRPDAKLPTRGSEHAAGLDLHAAGIEQHLVARPDRFVQVYTGVAVAIPRGLYGQILPRSGLAARRRVIVHPGVIDSDYRGELIVLVSTLFGDLKIKSGDRIAQLLILPCATIGCVAVDELDETARGDGGLGSTGR